MATPPHITAVGIVKNPPFIDGNKQLMPAVMDVFLEINGYRLDAPEVEAADLILRPAAGEKGGKDLAGWLGTNSGPVPLDLPPSSRSEMW